MSGSKSATSRYFRLKAELDQELFNQNWMEVDLEQTSNRPTLQFADLFSGAGGLSVGFRNAGYRKRFSVEINSFASSTIRRNFSEGHHFERPIQDVTSTELLELVRPRELDVICGGPPCQGFSVAGRRRIDDERNTLFLEFCRVVELCQPAFFVMENVPGILTMQNGEVYRAILEKFAEIGYPDTSVRILEAAEYGVPQLRTRAIFIGNRLGLSNPYPRPTHKKEQYLSIDQAIGHMVSWPRTAANNHEWTAHSAQFEKRISQVPPGGSLYETFRDAFKRQHRGVPSMAVKENHGGTHIHYELNRVLSAREMAVLQTFPDDFYFEGGMKKAYWQIGNAVPCRLAEVLALAVGSSIRALRADLPLAANS
jgi:DNA (cytosine-5)-methyltransferase 1